MPRHSEQRKFPYPAELVFDVVCDVRSYPKFLPWCSGTRIRKETDNLIIADMVIRYNGLRESFTSRVHLDRSNLRIDVSYEDGPFKYLINNWRFIDFGDNCSVNFFIDFEFRSLIYGKLMGLFFNNSVQHMINAFETRVISIASARGVSSTSEGD